MLPPMAIFFPLFTILEDLGYLEKNHFASGRQPSEEGYKYYVENLMTPKDLTGEDMLKLQTIFHNQSLQLGDVIEKSLELIAELTNYTSVVLGKSSSSNKLKKVEVVPLDNYKGGLSWLINNYAI